ncbi:MAG: glucose dehydrogenase [Geminicoccaceae bacterium]|nr:glucose dehydrogenase [Geminicoccaceae bacterium]
MKGRTCLLWSAAVLLGSSGIASADMQGTGESGGWEKRVAVEPDPSKVVVPDGYEVGIFVKGLNAPSSATVDGDGNLWVAVSPPLLGSPDADQFEEAHVKVFDPQGKMIKEIGKGTFTTVMNEISYCAENGKVYIPEYAEKIWEIDGLDGELKLAIKDLFIGDHRNGGVTCKDGHLYFALGLPSNTGFADPDNHGWTDIPNDPFWLAHPDGHPATPHDPVCRDIVHTGLNVKSSDGRLTGGFLPVGVPAEPGMEIKATKPCGGSVMRVAFDQQGADGLYAHEDMEVYAMGFRNQSGVAFGPAGSRFADALAVSDNGANDLGNRRVANGAEKIWLVTEMGQDGGFPDKEGFLFVSGKRYGWEAYRGNPIDRPYPNLYIGEEPFVPTMWPYRFQHHVEGTRGVPHIVANPNPDGYINPILEWDTNNPIDGIAWSGSGFGKDNHLFGAVYGILDTGPESLVPTWPAVLDIEFLEPSGVKWSYFARNIEMGPNAYQQEANRGGIERPNDVVFSNDGRTMYIVDYGEVFTDFEMPSPFYTVAKSGVIWTVTRTGG